jgi:Ca2+-binding RTX toxin-like protein
VNGFRAAVLAVLLCGLAAVAPSAQAAKVKVAGAELRYRASAGEVNSLSIAPSATPGFIEVTDPGAAVQTGHACTRLTPTKASCSARRVRRLRLRLGDGGDTVKVSGTLVAIVRAGDGDDFITTGDGDDWMDGGEGNDTLRGGSGLGGGGDDTLFGGPGDDVLRGLKLHDSMFGGPGDDILDGGNGNGDDFFDGGPGADYLRGGRGFDTVSYAHTKRPVNVTLDNVADDGRPGEGDNTVADLEIVIGGSGDDRLVGDQNSFRPFSLFGGRGDDLLVGALGPDLLVGGSGRDRLSAGAGDDRLESRDAFRDELGCGTGTDSVAADDRDALDLDGPGSCESVEIL